jgi:hypothetical protein
MEHRRDYLADLQAQLAEARIHARGGQSYWVSRVTELVREIKELRPSVIAAMHGGTNQ